MTNRRLYRRVVIESPFGHPTKEGQDENLRYLRACMRDCLDRGEAPFASHGLYTQDGVLNDWDPQEREKGIQAGFEWRAVAHATVVYADRGITPGMRAGIRKATDLQQGGIFDHYVEYRMLGGEWSALGGPDEIKKHLHGLLEEHHTKHRHLALVTGPSGSEKLVHAMPTPGELSLEGVPRRAEDGTIVTTVEQEALHAKPFLRSEKPNSNGPYPRLKTPDELPGGMLAPETPTSKEEKFEIPPWTVDERAAWKERERAKSMQQQPPLSISEEADAQEAEARAKLGADEDFLVPVRDPEKLKHLSKKSPVCEHGAYRDRCEKEHVEPPGPRGRMQDGLVPPARDPDKDSW